jgi:AcrR family transcriptional regulator
MQQQSRTYLERLLRRAMRLRMNFVVWGVLLELADRRRRCAATVVGEPADEACRVQHDMEQLGAEMRECLEEAITVCLQRRKATGDVPDLADRLTHGPGDVADVLREIWPHSSARDDDDKSSNGNN